MKLHLFSEGAVSLLSPTTPSFSQARLKMHACLPSTFAVPYAVHTSDKALSLVPLILDDIEEINISCTHAPYGLNNSSINGAPQDHGSPDDGSNGLLVRVSEYLTAQGTFVV